MEKSQKRYAAQKASAIVQKRKPTIRIGEDGKPMTMRSWGQEMPSGDDEFYFWQMLQDVKSKMTKEYVQQYCTTRKIDDDETDITVLTGFIEHVLSQAEAVADERDAKAEENIKEVRRSIDFYKDEGISEEVFEGDDE